MDTPEKHDLTSRGEYRDQLFRHVPLYTTRLVREGEWPFRVRDQVSTPADVAIILQDYFRDRDREEFLLCMLDTANTLIGLSCLSIGGLATSVVEPRQVFKTALLANAAAIIVAHNHISGNPTPSREDLRITRMLVEASKLMGVPLHDHLIVTERGYVSLAEKGWLKEWER